MIYSDLIHIEEMARERLSRKGMVVNVDLDDYRSLVAASDQVFLVHVRSAADFPCFLSELRSEIQALGLSTDALGRVMVHLVAHPQADVTMANYAALGNLIGELLSTDHAKLGFACDASLPENLKDIAVFVAK